MAASSPLLPCWSPRYRQTALVYGCLGPGCACSGIAVVMPAALATPRIAVTSSRHVDAEYACQQLGNFLDSGSAWFGSSLRVSESLRVIQTALSEISPRTDTLAASAAAKQSAINRRRAPAAGHDGNSAVDGEGSGPRGEAAARKRKRDKKRKSNDGAVTGEKPPKKKKKPKKKNKQK